MRILIADDDPVSVLILESALREWGYEVVVARDGAAAWDTLKQADAPPLAILDWMMPGLDGPDICRKVREESEAPYIYLIMLTGRTEKRDLAAGIDAGADDYIAKPFDETELQARLRAGRRIVELQDALRIQATFDALTDIRNRRSIMEILEREMTRSKRHATPVGVLIADLDGFKRVNDTHGHLVGDEVLREVSRRIGAALRPYDTLGRYGGEEFLMILPNCDRDTTRQVAERVRCAVSEAPLDTSAGPVPLTISVGAATDPGIGDDADALIRAADEAMYRAKRSGKNRVEVAPELVLHC